MRAREFGREPETHEFAADDGFRLHGWKLTWFCPVDKLHLLSGFNPGWAQRDSVVRRAA